MVDEPVYKGADDEYSYSESSTRADVFGTSSSDSFAGNLQAMLGRLAVVAVVAFIGIAGYKIYGHYTMAKRSSTQTSQPDVNISTPSSSTSSTPSLSTEQQTTSPTPSSTTQAPRDITPVVRTRSLTAPITDMSDATAPATTPVNATAPATTIPAPTGTTATPPVVSSADTQALQNRLIALERQSINRSNQLRAMQDNLDKMRTQLNDINSNITSVRNDVEAVRDGQKQLSNKIVMTQRRAQARRTAARHHSSRQAYYLQAAIPGRAWLMSANGSTMTVSQGSNIKGYGFVRKIDAIKGKVYTSSGYTISFNMNDS